MRENGEREEREREKVERKREGEETRGGEWASVSVSVGGYAEFWNAVTHLNPNTFPPLSRHLSLFPTPKVFPAPSGVARQASHDDINVQKYRDPITVYSVPYAGIVIVRLSSLPLPLTLPPSLCSLLPLPPLPLPLSLSPSLPLPLSLSHSLTLTLTRHTSFSCSGSPCARAPSPESTGGVRG